MSKLHSRELASINQSLQTLGQCIQALSLAGPKQRDAGKRGSVPHVPYRDSTLTMLLRDSLAGSGLTSVLCTICGCAAYQMQTLCTLRFADRVKRVKMQVRMSEASDERSLLRRSQAEVMYLRSLVAEANGNEGRADPVPSIGNSSATGELQQRIAQLEKENRSLKVKLASMATDQLGPAAPTASPRGAMHPSDAKLAENGAAGLRRSRRTNSEPAIPVADLLNATDFWEALREDTVDNHRIRCSLPAGHRLLSAPSHAVDDAEDTDAVAGIKASIVSSLRAYPPIAGSCEMTARPFFKSREMENMPFGTGQVPLPPLQVSEIPQAMPRPLLPQLPQLTPRQQARMATSAALASRIADENQALSARINELKLASATELKRLQESPGPGRKAGTVGKKTWMSSTDFCPEGHQLAQVRGMHTPRVSSLHGIDHAKTSDWSCSIGAVFVEAILFPQWADFIVDSVSTTFVCSAVLGYHLVIHAGRYKHILTILTASNLNIKLWVKV